VLITFVGGPWDALKRDFFKPPYGRLNVVSLPEFKRVSPGDPVLPESVRVHKYRCMAGDVYVHEDMSLDEAANRMAEAYTR